MHEIQELILKISQERNVSDMKLSELKVLIGAKHLQQVKHHRNMLISKGLLLKPEQTKQAFKQSVLGPGSQLVNIPVMGPVNAGAASLYADGRVESYLRMSSKKLRFRYKKTIYALKAVGDSMDKAEIGPEKLNIEPGDYIVADGEGYSPKSGDYVVSIINNMANVKKLIIDREKQQIALLSESSIDYPPIIISTEDQTDYLAQSKVLHVVKNPANKEKSKNTQGRA